VACYVTDFPNAKTANSPKVIAIPHLGASTPESEDNCAIMAVMEIIDYIENGNITNSVNMPTATLPRTNDPRICVIHKNIPDMIAKITSAVSSLGINIENMVNAGAKGILITPSDTKAIVPSIQKARDKGVVVIALDTATEPQSAVDALFATNNFNAGLLIGQWAKAAMAGKTPKIATLDLQPGITVGAQRHNGFLQGFGLGTADPNSSDLITAPEVVCSQDTHGDQTEGQTAMENCLSKNPDINLVYTINEPAAFGAYQAIKAAGKDKDITIVSVDGGCRGVQGIVDGQIAATSQQYPLKMASMGVDALVKFAQTGVKPSGYTDTGVTLITDKPQAGVDSKDSKYGTENCWGEK
jgi:fructose transport system substrate-binding protein